MKNFTNGALVFRIWSFDGSGEIIAKFQYRGDAEDYAKARAAEDMAKRPNDASKWFYIASCEAENSLVTYQCKQPSVGEN